MSIIWVLLAIGIFTADTVIKNKMEKYIPVSGKSSGERSLLGGRLRLRLFRNRGAMLGLGEKRNSLVAACSVVLTVCLSLVFLCSLGKKGKALLQAGLSLLLGGAYSNTYDRLKRKYVVDYCSLNVGWEPLRRVVFNLSDLCIMVGALLLVLGAA